MRLTLAGVGGAFGAREDLSMQVHACLLALHTGKPVKMVYSREESFFGHVHRHPARLRYEHGADRDGQLVYVKARIVLDGGAYASSTPAVVGQRGDAGRRPVRGAQRGRSTRTACYTNNPPCGAMRGFGAVQACFAYESQMDKLAAALGLDPVEVRIRNAMTTGSRHAHRPGRARARPRSPSCCAGSRPAAAAPAASDDLRELPGGVSNTTHGEGVVRGVGYAVGIKNVCFSEGFDDYSTARVRLEVIGGEPAVLVHTAAAEVGQGLVTVQAQIARTELGVERVTIATADTTVGSAGSSSASRQTYMTGGAVQAACQAVRATVLARVAGARPDHALAGGKVVDARPARSSPTWSTCSATTRSRRPSSGGTGPRPRSTRRPARATPTCSTPSPRTGPSSTSTSSSAWSGSSRSPPRRTSARRSTRRPSSGQIHGGTAQGLGLAVMEEIQVVDGMVRNPSFTDYLIPTILDMPPMHVDVLELADPHAPYGLRGVGEPPTISSTPAIVAAIRAATGLALTRVPVRPEHLTVGSADTLARPA